MREDKFKPIKARFIEYFEQECRKINAEFRHASCNVETHFPPNDEPKYGYFSMHLSCLLHKTEFEGADNLSLHISAYDWDNKFTIDAGIGWGHPSGKIEAEVFEKTVPVNEESLSVIEEELPDLVSKLRQLLLNNSPKNL